MEQNKKLIVILIIIIAVALIGAVLYSLGGLPSFKGRFGPVTRTPDPTPRVIEDTLLIPETKNITGADGRMITEGSVDTPLVPKNEGEKIIVPKAVLTVKGSYDLAHREAMKWSGDAKLVFVKSLGTVTLEGKSSQWQLVFSSASAKATADKSKTKQRGYEVIIHGDQVVSKKEVDSTTAGFDLPKSWKDSGVAIQMLQELPQFSDATISALTLYYNTDGKIWRYGLSTSKGTTSVSVE